LAGIIKYGQVRSFKTKLTSNVETWNTNKLCRSVRFTNQGTTNVELTSEGITEILLPQQTLTEGGYPYSMRYSEYAIEFAGGTGELIIAQDIQQIMPYGELGEVKICDSTE
jgi:hypothetical protein